MNLKSSQRLVVFVLFFKFHGTLSATQYFVRENEMMPGNIKDSKSIARTIQCSSWVSSCRTETCFSIVTLLHRKQKQISETLANVCAYWATAFVWCIFLHCLHFTLPQFFAQNLQKPKHRVSTIPPVPLRLLLSSSDLGSYTVHCYTNQFMNTWAKAQETEKWLWS